MKLPEIGYKTSVAPLARTDVMSPLATRSKHFADINKALRQEFTDIGRANRLARMDLAGETQLARMGVAGETRLAHMRVSGEAAIRRADLQVDAVETQTVVTAINALTDVGVQAANVYMHFYNQRVKEEVTKNDVAMTQAETDWVKQHAGREYYSPSEVPEGINVQRTTTEVDPGTGETFEIDRQIPAYEVQAAMKKQYLEERMTALTSDIQDNQVAARWAADKQIVIDRKFQGDAIQAQVQRQRVVRQDHLRALDMAVEDRDWLVAEELAMSYPGTELEQQQLIRGVRNNQDKAYLNDTLISRDLTELRVVRERLEDRDLFTALSDKERIFYISSYEAAINKATVSEREGLKLYRQIVNDQASSVIKRLLDGDFIPNSAIIDTEQKLISIGTHGVRNLSKFYNAQNGYAEAARTKTFNRSEQLVYIDQYKKHINTLPPGEQVAASERLARHEDRFNTWWAEQKNNPMDYAHRSGLINLERPDFVQMLGQKDTASLGQIVLQRYRQATKVFNRFGQYVGLLDEYEVPAIANWVAQATDDDKMWFATTVSNTLGENAQTLYDQFENTKSMGNFPMIGEVVAEGKYDVGRKLLRGERVLANEPQFISGVNRDVINATVEAYGTTFKNNPVRRNQITQAVRALYALQASYDGNTTNFNSDYIDNAVRDLSNNILEMNGRNFESPHIGVTQDIWDNHIEKLTPERIQELGDPKNFTSNQIILGLKNETLEIESYRKNQYFLVDPAGNMGNGAYVQNKDDSMFIYQFDPNDFPTTRGQDKPDAPASPVQPKPEPSWLENRAGLNFFSTTKIVSA